MTPDRRRKYLAMIHMGAKQVGLITADGDKSAYQDMLRSLTGVDSVAKIKTLATMNKVVAHLKRSGADLGGKKPSHATYKRGTPGALIRHLWDSLNKSGAVRDGSDRALRSYIKRQSKSYHPDGVGYDHPNLLPDDVASKIIEQLKLWCRRTETDW